jgi:vacuolar-type H+-ATPase subunit I/STV1
VKHYDLTKGRYGFSVSIGKAYKSRVEQGQDQIGQLLQADPQLLNLIGDIYFKFADFPGHTEIAERLKKMLPPQAQPDDAQGDPQQQLQQLQQQLAQVMAQHKALTDELNAKNEMIQTEQVKFASQKDIEQLKGSLQIRLKEMDNAKAIRVAEIAAAIKGYQVEAQHAAQHEAQALDIAAESVESDISRESDTAEAETQRQHEAEMAQLGHQQALEQGAQATEGQIAAIKAKPQPTGGAGV